MNTTGKVIVGGILVGGLTYIILHFQRQKYLFSNSCFKLGGFVPVSVGTDETKINIKMYIKNKSDIGFTIKNQRYDLYLNDKYITTLEKPEKIYISANYLNEEWLSFNFNPKQAFGTLVSTLIDKITGKSNMRVSIKFSLKIGTGLFAMNYRDEINTTVEEMMSIKSPPCS